MAYDYSNLGKKLVNGTGSVLSGGTVNNAGDIVGNTVGGISDTLAYDPAADDAAAAGYVGQATHAYNGLTPPKLGNVDLKGPEYVGDVNPTFATKGADVSAERVDPTLANAASQGDTEMKNISSDPRLRGAQLQALSSLQDVGETGMNATDKAQLAQIAGSEAQADRGRQGAIMQNLAERGQAGSGNELLQRLTSTQSATDRQASQDMNVAAQSEQRRMDAINAAGNLGGSIRGQDFGEQSASAQAQDAINNFNARNTTANNQNNASIANNIGVGNADRGLGAQEFNSAGTTNTSATNAGIANTVGMHNQGTKQGVNTAGAEASNQGQVINKVTVPQTTFGDQATIAGGKAGAAGMGVGYYGGKSAAGQQAKANTIGSFIQGGTQLAKAAHGGRVPGAPAVEGDSALNDFVPVSTSPGEVVVPRSLAHAPAKEIGDFVHHAPAIKGPKDKEAMLSALAHIRHRGH